MTRNDVRGKNRNGISITSFDHLLSIKAKHCQLGGEKGAQEPEQYVYEVQSIRGRWTIKKSMGDFKALSSALSGKFQPLPLETIEADVTFEKKNKVLSKWLSALFWLIKGRNVKQIESYNDGKDKNIDLVFNFLCKTTNSQNKTVDNLGKEKSADSSTKKILRVSTKFVSKKAGQNVKTLIFHIYRVTFGPKMAEVSTKLAGFGRS